VRSIQQGAYVCGGFAVRSPLIWRLTGRRYENYRPADEVGACPPAGSPQLTEQEENLFIQWIDAGAQWSNIVGMGDLPGFREEGASGRTQAYYDRLAEPIDPAHVALEVSRRCVVCHRSDRIYKAEADNVAAWRHVIEQMRQKEIRPPEHFNLRFGDASRSIADWVKPDELDLVAQFLTSVVRNPGALPDLPEEGGVLEVQSPVEQDAYLWLSGRAPPNRAPDFGGQFVLSMGGRQVWNHDLGNVLLMGYYPGYMDWPVGIRLRKGVNRIELKAVADSPLRTNCRLSRLTEVAGFTDPRWVLARGLDVRVKAAGGLLGD
jgi:hypothetical protein